MKRQRLSHRLRCGVIALAGAAVIMTSGCGHKSTGSSGSTTDQVKAFRGAPPTAEDRKEMAQEMQRARQRAQLPQGFSSVAPAPPPPGGK